MDELVALCKRRGFVFQSSEIYNGLAGFFDFGPLGAEMKKNIKDKWWQDVVRRRDDIVGLDSSIISSPKVWEASGHVAGFSDPMVDCKETKHRFRADQLFFSKLKLKATGEVIGAVCVQESPSMEKDAKAQAKKFMKANKLEGEIEEFDFKDLTKATADDLAIIPSPMSGTPGTLTPPRDFNLISKLLLGQQLVGADSTAYLRPETAQGIFTNFKNVQQTARIKLPFGIAQIGKAFRNEITPRNFIFRSREFEQMEVEYFFSDDDEEWKTEHQKWIDFSWDWLKSVGLREELMALEVHEQSELAHYARACTDITFRFPFGQSELQGIAARGCYDLNQHQEASGKSMEYMDESNKKFLPHVIEPSLGVDRLFLALLVSAYHKEEVEGETRTLLKFHPSIAPIKVAVLPLMKNKENIVELARGLYQNLSYRHNCFWDVSGAIGRRYRRMDEAGTPFCVTVDFQSLEDETITIRNRDTMDQIRMPITEVAAYIDKEVNGY
eukprot:CAMPEP_0171465780 /NCGR_PEP_ID=MMETSP0945-20130129/8758_1 /TAXON_ID=109269 /ORGANISM="Vaucheria litorea, Strain CCMP2940" /LENGTH=496 /DNA_ID=CAMNT_0011993529 /DNA_START=282 /DNA_END=1773 /DNA_ORIENTATION=-